MSKDYMVAPWFVTLQTEVANSTRQAVADKLGYSRTTISLVISGKYPGKTDDVAARVAERLGGFACLYDGQTITPEQCRKSAKEAAPTHNPSKMAKWSACQNCHRYGGV